MKTFTLIALLFISFLSANAQMSLESTFPHPSHTDSTTRHILYISESGASSKVCNFLTRNDSVLKIFNLDYSLYKTLTIPLSILQVPVNHKILYYQSSINISYMSKKLFNNDDKIEFLLTYTSYDSTNTSSSINKSQFKKTILFNEDLTLLQSFENMSVGNLTLTSNNQYILSMLEYGIRTGYFGDTYYEGIQTNIYSLGGTYSQSLKSTKTGAVQTPYPNPAQTTITLPYTIAQGTTATLKIYSINGALIDEKKIDSYFSSILLNVSSYSPGTYIYEYNGISNKFIIK